jgi:chemotaxis protein MotA
MAEKNRRSTDRKPTGRPDLATFAGLVLAAAGILGGLLLEGGNISDVSQITAAFIVLGGTCGAVMVSTPRSLLGGAAKRMGAVLFEGPSQRPAVAAEIIEFATKARKSGLVALEGDAAKVADLFLKKALNLAVDGTDLQELRAMLELEIEQHEQRAEAEAKVFEAAGGFAPTIGIIGAVLGLIQVMKNLSDIDRVGHGIAVSFVATVYGVGLSNLLLLPIASKIKLRASEETGRFEMILEGIIGIVEGMNPKLISAKLEAFVPPAQVPKNAKSAPAARTPGTVGAAAES